MATMTLDELVSQLSSAYGPALRAAVLYGSAAAEGEHIAKRSDFNVLVVADALPLAQLHAVGAITRAWGDAGNPPPLTLTTAEWRSSSDIFPMEYADILERHRVLHGELPVEGIRVKQEYLRLEVEQQAMGKLLKLRQGVIATGGDQRRQIELLEASFGTIMVIFRAFVRMHGDRPPFGHEPLIQEVGRRTAVDVQAFVAVARHVRGESPLPRAQASDVLAGYLQGMEALVAHVDRHVHGGAGASFPKSADPLS